MARIKRRDVEATRRSEADYPCALEGRFQQCGRVSREEGRRVSIRRAQGTQRGEATQVDGREYGIASNGAVLGKRFPQRGSS